MRVVAILETMWDWRGYTSAAGYGQAPRYFRINPQNFSGRRLYKLCGPGSQLLVTNACRMLAAGPNQHGTGDPVWLAENLKTLDDHAFHVLLVCGRIAQDTFERCGYRPKRARIVKMPHPAARQWTVARLAQTTLDIQAAYNSALAESLSIPSAHVVLSFRKD